MEAIILAGGFGTRLAPLTYTRPKSLLPIMNKPMIGYIIEQLPEEVDKVILALNYRKKQIEEFFEKNDFGKEIIINDEPKPLGTGGAVKFAEKHITGDFFVLNSDIISSLNMDGMIKFHRKNNSFSTISLWPVENVSEFGVVDIEGDRITRFVEKPEPEEAPSNLINAGAYMLQNNILDYIEIGRLVSMEKEVFPRIIEDGKNFFGFRIKDYWMDIGRISSYIKIHNFLMGRWGLENKVTETCKNNGILKKSCLGNNVVVEDDAKILNSVIYDNNLIEAGVEIKNSVVGENCRIGKKSRLVDVVVGDGEFISPETDLKDKKLWTRDIPEDYPKKQIGNTLR